jgi:hypothetical protein
MRLQHLKASANIRSRNTKGISACLHNSLGTNWVLMKIPTGIRFQAQIIKNSIHLKHIQKDHNKYYERKAQS